MTLMFTTIGSAADYGTFGRWLLLSVTVVCWGAQFGLLGANGNRAPTFLQYPSHPSIRNEMAHSNGALHPRLRLLRCYTRLLCSALPSSSEEYGEESTITCRVRRGSTNEGGI